MAKDRTVIEFYNLESGKLIIRIETEAPAPLEDSKINILKTDYTVIHVDHSIDHTEDLHIPTTYRRNVFLKRIRNE